MLHSDLTRSLTLQRCQISSFTYIQNGRSELMCIIRPDFLIFDEDDVLSLFNEDDVLEVEMGQS